VGAIRRDNLHDKHWKPLLKKAGLPDIRFHDLRHTCATLLLTKGVHPKIVSELLGHSSVTITLDTYSHVMPGMQEVAARAMEEMEEALGDY
jgi:integrase